MTLQKEFFLRLLKEFFWICLQYCYRNFSGDRSRDSSDNCPQNSYRNFIWNSSRNFSRRFQRVHLSVLLGIIPDFFSQTFLKRLSQIFFWKLLVSLNKKNLPEIPPGFFRNSSWYSFRDYSCDSLIKSTIASFRNSRTVSFRDFSRKFFWHYIIKKLVRVPIEISLGILLEFRLGSPLKLSPTTVVDNLLLIASKNEV